MQYHEYTHTMETWNVLSITSLKHLFTNTTHLGNVPMGSEKDWHQISWL